MRLAGSYEVLVGLSGLNMMLWLLTRTLFFLGRSSLVEPVPIPADLGYVAAEGLHLVLIHHDDSFCLYPLMLCFRCPSPEGEKPSAYGP